jgi:hypothetical protein
MKKEELDQPSLLSKSGRRWKPLVEELRRVDIPVRCGVRTRLCDAGPKRRTGMSALRGFAALQGLAFLTPKCARRSSRTAPTAGLLRIGVASIRLLVRLTRVDA